MSALPTRSRYDVSRDDLADLLGAQPRYRVDQVWAGLHEHLGEPDEWTNLPRALRAELAEHLPAALTAVTESASNAGDTVKFLWELDGGSRIETRADALPRPGDRLREHAGGMCDGMRVLRDRAGGVHAPPDQRRDRRAGRARHAAGPIGRASRVERRVHGDGRTARQRGRGLGCGRADPRRSRPVGASHHDQHGGDRARDPRARRATAARQPGREPPRRQRRACATSWSRSTVATPSTRCSARASTT